MDRTTPPPWVPDVAAADNRPSLHLRPRWHLFLDDPAPRDVLVVGQAAPGTETWLAELDAHVRRVGAPRGLPREVDLVIVGSDVARPDRHDLRWLARCCGEQGGLWLPGAHTPRADRALTAAGFAVQRWSGRRRRRLGPLTPGAGVVACPRGPHGRPPTWLAGLGRSVGWDPDGGSWSLRTPSAYPSQKAVAMLGPGIGSGGSAVVKVAQDVRFNGRLENEARVLHALLTRSPRFAARRAPGVLATDHVGGLVAVAEQALVGRPFLEASRLRPDCPLAADAVRAVTELGLVARASTPGSDLAGPLAGIVERFAAVHRPPAPVTRFLSDQVDAIAGHGAVPTVLFHGDLGTWNLLVAEGRVRILDWESAAPGAPPLWDLFYMLRSYAVRSGRHRGLPRDRAIGRHLIEGSPLTDAMAGWVRTYCESVAIDPRLAAPLFHLCWAHRAVKEAARLAPGQPGHYGPLCVRLATTPTSSGLRLLLAG